MDEKTGTTLNRIIEENRNAEFDRIEVFGSFSRGEKFTGAVWHENRIYAVPNTVNQLVVINPDFEQDHTPPYEMIDLDYEPESFGYTGGTIYHGKLYAFPRTRDDLLEIDLKDFTVRRLSLPFVYDMPRDHNSFHHYAGVRYRNKIYCSPKLKGTVLVIDLDEIHDDSVGAYEIRVPDIDGKQYHSATVVNEDTICFHPSKGARYLLLDARTDELRYIGDPVADSIFKLFVYPEQLTYGFGMNGTICILNLETGESRSVSDDRFSGLSCYGAMMGPNGRLYSAPGSGNLCLEFNPKTEQFRKIQEIRDPHSNYAKCAGQCLSRDGSIWQIPACGRFIYRLRFRGVKAEIPGEILAESPFSGY